ncbi:MAG: hypothetical protein HUU35_14515, partial [Armatimonadetes bacterium]|nr:hypothetical protein [Armatimonadota bacterium]
MLATLVVLALATTALPLDQLRTERRELARRPRGIIYNNDGCDALYYPKDKPLTVDSFLAARTSGVAGSQVGAIAYCTISSGFGFFTHATRAGQVLTRQSADYGLMPAYRNVTQELIELGGDCFQQVLTWGHANRTEVFWSMRMNDTHDVAHRPDKPYLLYPPLKEQHPEWLVGDWLKPTPHGRWSSVDYGRPEVRELAFRYLEEVCTNYDLDGVELDWLRHSCFFRSVAQGGKASDAERGAVTDLMRRVRAMTEAIGQRRGRPILVAIRVPDSVDYCRDLGLDLETWLGEGLADILITTCYFRLNPWSYTVGLARRHGVVAYPCLSDSRVQGETRFRRGSLEGYRGRAANAWAAGADGIHLFNIFNPAAPQFRELGSPAALRGKDKLFFVTYRDGDPADWLAGGEAYRTVPVLTPAHPVALQPQPCELEFEVGEEFGTGAPTVTLHLELPGLEQPARLRAALNEQPLGAVTASGDWLDFPVQAAW